MADKYLDRLLRFDPIDTAEQISGGDRDSALPLGMLLATGHNLHKHQVLEGLDDTTFANRLDRYLRICADLGFETVIDLPFEGRRWDSDPPPAEHFYILARRDGLLLTLDTFLSDSVNGAKIYYNWRPHVEPMEAYHMTSSGHWHGYDTDSVTWIGDHDAREALRHKISVLEQNGEFLAPWVEQPFLWLLHYQDSKTDSYDYQQINRDRIAMLPDWVQNMITPEKNT